MPDVATTWMSYDDLATALSISRESARQLVIRKKWPRRKGNDGKARIGVPEEAVRPNTGPSPCESTDESTSVHTSPAPSEETVVLRVKNAQLETELRLLNVMLEQMRQDRDRWHAEATRRRWVWPWRRAG